MQGLYVHVPFCISKCPYCDFYSIPLPSPLTLDDYTDEVCRRLRALSPCTPSDTLYFGGGTPSLLGGERLARIIRAARDVLLTEDAEITLEANPADRLYDTFSAFAAVGGNRVSMGMQAATADGLSALGRRHTPQELDNAVDDLHRAGITNLSLDLMLATPSQTTADIDRAVALCRDYDAQHASAYLLKVEPNTPFGKHPPVLPDEDTAADLYLHACQALEAAGFEQYEISNFAKGGKVSRHNLKYWLSEPYIGIGPAAHSFIRGKRYYMPRSLQAFLAGEDPTEDLIDTDGIPPASEEEFALLRLRLTEGLRADAFEARFARPIPAAWLTNAAALPKHLVCTSHGIALTREGFLLSNALIARILWGDEN